MRGKRYCSIFFSAFEFKKETTYLRAGTKELSSYFIVRKIKDKMQESRKNFILFSGV